MQRRPRNNVEQERVGVECRILLSDGANCVLIRISNFLKSTTPDILKEIMGHVDHVLNRMTR